MWWRGGGSRKQVDGALPRVLRADPAGPIRVLVTRTPGLTSSAWSPTEHKKKNSTKNVLIGKKEEEEEE